MNLESITKKPFVYEGIHREDKDYDDSRHPSLRHTPLTSDPKTKIRFSLTFQRENTSKQGITFITYSVLPPEELRYRNFQAVKLSQFEEQVHREKFKDPDATTLMKRLGNYFWDNKGPFLEFSKERLAARLPHARPKTDPNATVGYIDNVSEAEWNGLFKNMFEDWREEINEHIANPVLFIYRGYGIYAGRIAQPIGKGGKHFQLLPGSRRLFLFELKGRQCGFGCRDVDTNIQDYKTEYDLSRVTQMYSLFRPARQD
jgi:hypothetical protein